MHDVLGNPYQGFPFPLRDLKARTKLNPLKIKRKQNWVSVVVIYATFVLSCLFHVFTDDQHNVMKICCYLVNLIVTKISFEHGHAVYITTKIWQQPKRFRKFRQAIICLQLFQQRSFIVPCSMEISIYAYVIKSNKIIVNVWTEITLEICVLKTSPTSKFLKGGGS